MTGTAPLAVVLLVHGLAKLLTVTALLRRAFRCSPRALAALSILLVAQLADLVTAPAVGGTVLAVLDVVVITLVTWEYRRLRRERAVPAEREVRAGRIERAAAR